MLSPVAYLQDHFAGELGRPEKVKNSPVRRHFFGIVRVAIHEQVRVVSLLAVAEREAFHRIADRASKTRGLGGC